MHDLQTLSDYREADILTRRQLIDHIFQASASLVDIRGTVIFNKTLNQHIPTWSATDKHLEILCIDFAYQARVASSNFLDW